jgi:hypothetical protein
MRCGQESFAPGGRGRRSARRWRQTSGRAERDTRAEITWWSLVDRRRRGPAPGKLRPRKRSLSHHSSSTSKVWDREERGQIDAEGVNPGIPAAAERESRPLERTVRPSGAGPPLAERTAGPRGRTVPSVGRPLRPGGGKAAPVSGSPDPWGGQPTPEVEPSDPEGGRRTPWGGRPVPRGGERTREGGRPASRGSTDAPPGVCPSAHPLLQSPFFAPAPFGGAVESVPRVPRDTLRNLGGLETC